LKKWFEAVTEELDYGKEEERGGAGEEGLPQIMGRRGFLLVQIGPLDVDIHTRGLMRDG